MEIKISLTATHLACWHTAHVTWSTKQDRTNQKQRHECMKIWFPPFQRSVYVCCCGRPEETPQPLLLPSPTIGGGRGQAVEMWMNSGWGWGGHSALITCCVRGLHGLWALHAASHSITAAEWGALSRCRFGWGQWSGTESGSFGLPELMYLTAMKKKAHY